jgi:hypothetical protein
MRGHELAEMIHRRFGENGKTGKDIEVLDDQGQRYEIADVVFDAAADQWFLIVNPV